MKYKVIKGRECGVFNGISKGDIVEIYSRESNHVKSNCIVKVIEGRTDLGNPILRDEEGMSGLWHYNMKYLEPLEPPVEKDDHINSLRDKYPEAF